MQPFFPKLGQRSLWEVSQWYGPRAEPRPTGAAGPSGSSRQCLSPEKARIPPRGTPGERPTATGLLILHMPEHPGVGAEELLEGTGTHKTNPQLGNNTEPETKIHDQYQEVCSRIPQEHIFKSMFSKKPF